MGTHTTTILKIAQATAKAAPGGAAQDSPATDAPAPLWQRPKWIESRYGVSRHTLEKAWRNGYVTRAKLDDGDTGTVIYLVQSVDRWIGRLLDDPGKKRQGKAAPEAAQ